MLIAAAVAGLGVALVPEKTVEAELADATLILASRRRLSVSGVYSLLYPESSMRNSAFAAFRSWLINEMPKS
jgi:DNA-binding transcriptional LysR family regulator